jgi:hypothetical protein
MSISSNVFYKIFACSEETDLRYLQSTVNEIEGQAMSTNMRDDKSAF